MISQGVTITARCDACGGVLTRDVGQFIDRGRLRWGTEGACRSCTVAWCDRSSGSETPEEIRQALLSEHGPVRLRLIGPGTNPVAVLRALREVNGLSLTEAKAMAGELKTAGLVGTLVEMEFVAARLRQRAVRVAVETSPC
ncbi:hypothetical protein ABZ461_11745 [Actinacidiphila glaucinigra]|uniref:hypothetical protein n=1 Tax=Actinacidiphila glaucinigra TaxID=235986 RepID=UPI0033C0F1F3